MRRPVRWTRYHQPEPRARRWARDLGPDLLHALRQLRRAPGMTAFIVATLALGIGANVTMAGIIDRLLLRPPPGVREPGRVVRVLTQTPAAPVVGTTYGYPRYLELARELDGAADVAAESPPQLSLGGGPDDPEVLGAQVSASYFEVLGVATVLGRTFGRADGYPERAVAGGPALVVLAHGFWQRQFGGDRSIVGRTIRLGTLPYTVVGVLAPAFRGLGPDVPDVWVPVTVSAAAPGVQPFLLDGGSGASWLTIVARLRPGARRETAEARATAVVQRNAPQLAAYDGTRAVLASLIRGRGPDAPRDVKVALWLGGLSALVLLIACANVANLLLARAFTRRREITVRLALGAGRGRLARQLLAEALVLAAFGGAGAMLLAAVGGSALHGFFLTADDAGSAFVDARLFAVTALVALGTGALVSLAPLAQSTTPDLTRTLRVGAAVGGGRTSRARTLLLGTQAALCVLLLVVAGLFAQSFRRVNGLDLGMDVDRTLRVSFSMNGLLMTNAERDAAYGELRERVTAIPGVRGVAFTGGSLRAVAAHTGTRDTEAHTLRTWGAPYEASVDSGYFRTLGSSLRGRDFTSADVRGAPPVTIINEPLAQLLFPGEDPIGQCVHLPLRGDEKGGECWTVVGVLRGYWYGRSILEREGLLAYVPLAQRNFGLGRPSGMVVAVDGNAAAIIPPLRAAILAVRPDLPRVHVQWMRDLVEPELRPWRLSATMFSLFGLVALVIAAVGLYAVVAFAAAQRATEIAVRIALGARARNVLAAVAGDALGAVAAGLAVGVLASLVIRGRIGPLLFQTSPSDPAVIVGVAGLLLAVTALAIVVPTTRALRRDPATVLRVD